MPVRGDPNAGEVLAYRNKANAAAYQNLSDDEYSIYTAPIFYALGGYPNYSAINVTDLDNINSDDILVPEIPQLDDVQQARYRPIYLESVDLSKVQKDKEFNTPAESATAIEKRLMQCFKKIATQVFLHHFSITNLPFLMMLFIPFQLARDSPLVGLEYLFIACSKSELGQGWCRVKTTQDEVLVWLDTQLNFTQLFPIYAQGGGKFAEIRQNYLDNIANNKTSETQNAQTRSKNKCDKIKTDLTAMLNESMCKSYPSTLSISVIKELRRYVNSQSPRQTPSPGLATRSFSDCSTSESWY